MAEPFLSRIDHLVYATPDLDAGVDGLERLLGVRAAPGGSHPGRGTRNALIALGPACYLEILGPDPAQAVASSPRWFGIDRVQRPRLVGWAAKATGLGTLVAEAARGGVRLGAVGAGSRHRPDGVPLRWAFTDPATVVAGGIVPFFIDWGDSPHPAATAPGGPGLISMRAQHPDPRAVRRLLASLAVELPVEAGPRATLIASLATNGGQVELR